MTEPSRYAVALDDLVGATRVPVDEQVEQHDTGDVSEHDESAGHLPGNVRPYGA